MTDHGLKISKDGKSVFDEDPLGIIFNSDKASFKIVKQGHETISVPSSGSTEYKSIDHGLGYTPAFIAYFQLSGDSTVSYMMYGNDLFSGAGEGCVAEVDKDRIRLGADPNGSSTYTALVTYYIFANRYDA